jgi:hypothetical protein
MRRGFQIKLPPAPAKRRKSDFRRLTRELENRRAVLIARLAGLDINARANPAYKCALNLINSRFHKTPVTDRQAVLEAAKWSISLLVRLSTQP